METRTRACAAQEDDEKALRKGLREEALGFKRRSPRGLVVPTVHVGRPGGARTCPVPVSEISDAHLRLEIAVVLCDAIRDRVPRPLLWLTRAGTTEPAPLDQSWWAATQAAWQEQGLAPAFAVVTRQGWRLEPGGARREWRRLRER